MRHITLLICLLTLVCTKSQARGPFNALELVKGAISDGWKAKGKGITYDANVLTYTGQVQALQHLTRGLVGGLERHATQSAEPTHRVPASEITYRTQKRGKHGTTTARVREVIIRGAVGTPPALEGRFKDVAKPLVEVVANVPKGTRIRVHDGNRSRRVTVTKKDKNLGNKVRITVVTAPKLLETKVMHRPKDSRGLPYDMPPRPASVGLWKVKRMTATFTRGKVGRPR